MYTNEELIEMGKKEAVRRERAKVYSKARKLAVNDLIKAHPGEFDNFYHVRFAELSHNKG